MPVSGFPPGTPALPDPPTPQGTLHDLFSVPAFIAIALACLVLSGGRGPLWLIYSIASGLVSAATFMMSGVGFTQDPNLVDMAGLWQRVSVITAFTWLTLLALGMRTTRDPRTPPGPS